MCIPKKITSQKTFKINSEINVNGDKSISHRAIIFSSLSPFVSSIDGLLESQDVFNTMNVFKQLGVIFEKKQHQYIVKNGGIKNFNKSNHSFSFDMGNSGTSARLLSGLFSSLENLKCTITGDSSLNKRPMERILTPLKKMGAMISSNNGFLPLNIVGQKLTGITYNLPIPSAQIKSAILLAGLNASKPTTIIESSLCRDHSEIMMKNLGIDIVCNKNNALNTNTITLTPYTSDIPSYDYKICGDFSSASFFIVATLLLDDSKLLIKNVNLNPLRNAFLDVCIAMGGKISILNKHILAGEVCGDIYIESSKLTSPTIKDYQIPIMIDEFPIFFVLCCFVNGVSTFHNLHELTHKESNRISSMAHNLMLCGFNIEYGDAFITIYGENKDITKKNLILDSFKDHRIAMSLIIMGLRSENAITIDNCENINTSFPDFLKICKKLNFNIKY